MIRAFAQILHVARELHSVREAGFTEAALAYPRDELALAMLCAFAGCAVKVAPNGWRYFPNEATKKAWGRVADAAREHMAVDAQDAARWRALMRTPRIKMQGSAGVDPHNGQRREGTYVHFGAEFWSIGAPHESGQCEPTWGRHCLTALADALIEGETA